MSKNWSELRSPASQNPSAVGQPLPLGIEAVPQEMPLRRHLRRYLSAIFRYKWLVLLITIVGTAAGAYAVRFISPEYVAQVMFWVEVSDGRERGPIRSTELLRSAAWVDLLKAYTVLDHAVREQRLYLNYANAADSSAFKNFTLGEDFRPGTYQMKIDGSGRRFELLTPQGRLFQRGVLGDSVGQMLGFSWVPSPAAFKAEQLLEFTVVPPRDAARLLSNRITTEMPENGNFLRLELRGTDPTRITNVLNAIAERYVSVAADLKRQKLRELAKILDEQLQSAGQNLRQAELALEGFRVSTMTLPSESSAPIAAGLEQTRDPVYANFFNLKIEREQLRRDRESISRALVQARDSGLVPEALEMIPSVKSSSELSQALRELAAKRAELRTLRSRYTGEHAQVRQIVAQIETLEHRTVPRHADELLAELGTREEKLDGLVNSASSELKSIPQRANEEARLRREVAVAEQIYTTLQARYEEARLATASSVPDVRVLDAASVPEQPVNDTRMRILMFAVLGSFGLALLCAVGLDRFDARVRYPEQVTQGLGLEILGAVPQTGRRKEKTAEDVSQLAESFRELLLNLRNAITTEGPIIVAITSPGPGDGKTFTSSNLALRCADDGHRTLLIDGDVRRGTQHKVFGIKRKPGLTDYLAGRINRDELIHTTQFPTLHVVPCGTHMQEGPKLLSSQRLVDLLEYGREHYDIIVMDTAPLGAGIDPVVLGQLAGHLVIVLRTGITDRELAQSKLEMLDRMPVHVLGAVLNAVPPHAVYGYYAYAAGYEAKDEEPAAPVEYV